MKSINRIILKGILASSPLLQKTSEDKPFACLRVKTEERVKKGDHERLRSNYHTIMVFAPSLVEKIDQGCVEGDIVCLEGRLHNRKLSDAEGKVQYIPQIIIDEGGKIEVFSSQNKVLKDKNKSLSEGALKEEVLYA